MSTPKYLQTLANLQSGGVAWSDATSVRTAEAAVLSMPHLTETYAAGETRIFFQQTPPTLTKTLTFTAPKDLTLRNLVFLPTYHLTNPEGVIIALYDQSYMLTFNDVVVAGTGPDVGSYLIGSGLPGGLFSLRNLLIAPAFNLRLAAGDTVSIDVYAFNLTGSRANPYNVIFTYDEGIDTSVKPSYFVGPVGGTATAGLFSIPAATQATGTIQVTSASIGAGESLTIRNDFSQYQGPYTSSAGGTLTGQSGGGASGANTFDSDITGITPIRDAILAALQDGSNAWADEPWYTFASSGADSIIVTRILEGLLGNTDEFTTTSGSLSLTPSGDTLGGATVGTLTVPLVTPTIGLDFTRVYFGGGVAQPILYPTFKQLDLPRFAAFNVGGSPEASFPPFESDTDTTLFRFSEGSVSVPGSTALSVDIENPISSSAGFAIAVGTAT